MVTTIGDFLQKVQEYQEKYREVKEHKKTTCIMNADLYNLRTRVGLGENYEELKEKMYKNSMMACDFYIKSFKKLSEYEDTLLEVEKDFVIQAGKTLSLDDIAYFSLQAEVDRQIEITNKNIENFVENVKELGYQSFRYYEALNFIGSIESFEKMFVDFYKTFEKKQQGDNAENENK